MKRKTTLKLRLKHTIMLALLISAFANSALAVTPPDPNLAPPGVEYFNSHNGYPDVITNMVSINRNNVIFGFFATTDSILLYSMSDKNQQKDSAISGIKTMITDNEGTMLFIATDINVQETNGDITDLIFDTVATGKYNTWSYNMESYLYFGSSTNKGILKYDNSKWDTIYPDDISYDFADNNSIKYRTTGNGIITDSGQVNDTLYSDIAARQIAVDPTNQLIWFSTTNDTLWVGSTFETDSKTNYTSKISDIGEIIDIKIATTEMSSTYIIGKNGIVSYEYMSEPDINNLDESGTWTTYTTADGIPNAEITSFEILEDGTMWIGTAGAGLTVIHPEIEVNLSVSSINQLTVDFSAEALNYYSPDSIFTFYFGDGNKDIQATISIDALSNHTYNNSGTYEVCVEVEDNGRIGGSCININITDEATPCAFANFDRPWGNMGTVTIINNSSVAGTPKYIWDMGDGTIYEDSINVTHTYRQNGKYTITLKALNTDSDCFSSTEQTVEIYNAADINIPVQASFSKKIKTDTVLFINSSTGNITGYQWDFGDGFTSTARNTIHIYDNPGVYKVKLTAFNVATKESSTTYRMVVIKGNEEKRYYVSFDYISAPKTTVVLLPTSASIDFNVIFAARVIGDADMFFWDFGDGTFKAAQGLDTLKHTYDKPGVYDVTLTVKSSDMRTDVAYGKFTKRVIVKVPENPVSGLPSFSDFLVAQFTPYINGNTVGIINRSIIPSILPGSFVRWDFGDGTYSTDPIPEPHTYTAPGVYNITLTVSGLRGTRLMSSYTVPVRIAPSAVPAFMADFSYYTDGEYVTFTNNSEGNANLFAWDFGDGKGYSTIPNPGYEYSKAGYYDVTLRIYDSKTKKMDEVKKEIVVNITTSNIKADFEYFDHGNRYIQFRMDTTTKYDVYSWDFDDGYNSNEQHPNHTFSKSGYYNVSLTVMRNSDNAMHTISKHIYVAPTETPVKGAGDPIMAEFVSSANTSNLDAAFEDRSYGNVTSWYWDFGDNSTPAIIENPTHVYTSNGYYNVCLTVQNPQFQHTTCKTVAVGDVSNKHSAFFSYYVDSDNNLVAFNNLSAGNVVKNEWNFGDNSSSTTENPNHTYTAEGLYGVCLTTTSGAGEIKTFCQDININTTDIDTCTFNCVWPGDANNDLEANHYDILTIGLNYGMQGPIRVGAENKWKGQNSQPWANYQADSTNNMHGDCNGDGVINENDIDIISEYFDYSHSPNPEDFSKAGGEWSLSCEIGEDLATPTKGAATTRTVRTILSGPLDKSANNEIYGLAYELELLGADGLDWTSIQLDFNGTFLSSVPDDLITFFTIDSTKKIIYISVCKNDQENAPNGGDVGTTYLTFPNGDGVNLEVIVTSNYGVQSDDQNTGTKVPIKGGTYSAIDDSQDVNKAEINAYPNPNNGTFYVAASNSKGGNLTIDVINIVGQSVYTSETEIGQGYSRTPINLGDIPQGMYTVKATINGNTSLVKIVVQ